MSPKSFTLLAFLGCFLTGINFILFDSTSYSIVALLGSVVLFGPNLLIAISSTSFESYVKSFVSHKSHHLPKWADIVLYGICIGTYIASNKPLGYGMAQIALFSLVVDLYARHKSTKLIH